MKKKKLNEKHGKKFKVNKHMQDHNEFFADRSR